MVDTAIIISLPSFRYTRDVHEPELLIPRRVLEDGSFSTYSLSNFYNRYETGGERGKRSTGTADDKLHLVLSFSGIDHHVELSPYHEFISPDMVVETRGIGVSRNLNDGLKFRRASDQQCHYRGHVRDHPYSRAALSLCNGVVGTSSSSSWITLAGNPARRRYPLPRYVAKPSEKETVETASSFRPRPSFFSRDQSCLRIE